MKNEFINFMLKALSVRQHPIELLIIKEGYSSLLEKRGTPSFLLLSLYKVVMENKIDMKDIMMISFK